MFVTAHTPNRRFYQIRFWIFTVALALLQRNGIHMQLAVGLAPTHYSLGVEFTFGLSTWNKKG